MVAILSLASLAEETEMPQVPAPVLKPGVPEPPVIEANEIVMRPGASVVVPVAYGHLNRIITPFDNPQVHTVSNAQIKVHENVLYIATEETKPVTLFITPSGMESPALPLILAPRQIPPREIRLKLPEEAERELRFRTVMTSSNSPAAKDTPYIATIKAIFKDLAKGTIPPGFVMRDPGPQDQVGCFQAGVVVSTGQVMEGPGMVLRVAVLRNTGTTEVELDETRCAGNWDTLAVAAWPVVRIGPNEAVELYVLSRWEEKTPESLRPSLLAKMR